jgi:hypothetical protein
MLTPEQLQKATLAAQLSGRQYRTVVRRERGTKKPQSFELRLPDRLAEKRKYNPKTSRYEGTGEFSKRRGTLFAKVEKCRWSDGHPWTVNMVATPFQDLAAVTLFFLEVQEQINQLD